MKRYLLVLLLAGCAAPPQGPTEAPPPVAPEPPPVKENVAVAGLMESARADAASGKLVQAASVLGIHRETLSLKLRKYGIER